MTTLDLAPLPTGHRLKVLRTFVGDSVISVAMRWGKDKSYVYRVERGELEPSPLEVRDIEEAAAAYSAYLIELDEDS